MEYRFDFDDQLPDLPTAFDFDEVADLFQRKLFRNTSSQNQVGTFRVKKMQDLKYRPAHRPRSTSRPRHRRLSATW